MTPLLAGSSLLLLFLLHSTLLAAQPLETRATVVDSASSLKDGYDYVVIGGGTSGLTVANRLTEDASGTRRMNISCRYRPTGLPTTSFRACD